MELVLSICLMASPAMCREEAVPVGAETPATASQCLMEAPIIVAEWSGIHPKWTVTRWRCGVHPKGKNI